VADDLGAVILLPDAPLRTLMGYEFYLWDVEDITGEDLILYDDLRTCAAEDADLGVDLSRVYAYGFSGGALFTTEVIRHRADTLAAAVEMSGGADVSIPLYSYTVAPYGTPSWTLPVLVISGGEHDVWPDPSTPLIDFDDASDTLADRLSYDGSLVLRCRHSSGHAVTLDAYYLSEAWINAHEFGQTSPYASGELSEDDAEWCTRIDPEVE
jgi:poly(3-hydroxybutyrate) depolymerase